jgi:hypothetical protein
MEDDTTEARRTRRRRLEVCYGNLRVLRASVVNFGSVFSEPPRPVNGYAPGLDRSRVRGRPGGAGRLQQPAGLEAKRLQPAAAAVTRRRRTLAGPFPSRRATAWRPGPSGISRFSPRHAAAAGPVPGGSSFAGGQTRCERLVVTDKPTRVSPSRRDD